MTSQTAIAKWIENQIGNDKPYDSLREMSEKLGIPLATLSRLKNGAKPRSDTLERLAAGIHMSVSDFLKMIEEMEHDPSVHKEIEMRFLSGLERLTQDEQEHLYKLMMSFLEKKSK